MEGEEIVGWRHSKNNKRTALNHYPPSRAVECVRGAVQPLHRVLLPGICFEHERLDGYKSFVRKPSVSKITRKGDLPVSIPDLPVPS